MGINKNCIGINRSYFANKKYVAHPSRATTSCTIEIILVSLALDDRVKKKTESCEEIARSSYF